ncbi:MAG: L-glyceraldehyde 3-phosphate reductase [Paracidovorax wautersii]|uniref:L-glyceraldehyde 3-phosphate reductase n=1 Tax=Paracidovorax wautersii TaxID=1177982 RepID=A0A7V8JS07_9BURK|nr:MAG: L-glyceraldehyde 3-phosphate reductase [Paracidovorax wautersii]
MSTYRYLGRSGLQVSPIALGTMMFGGPTDEATAQRIIAHAEAHGINFIDTADVYQKGTTEQVVGRAIRADRDDWVLATKFGNPLGEGPNRRGSSRKWIIEAVENSLRRLGTDYIDLLYFHRADFNAPLGEAVRAVGDLIRSGKVRYFGVSNFRGWRIAEVAHLADAEGIDRPIASQPLYNLVNRSAEVEELPAAAAYGLGVVSYSPLARGVLTAKYPSCGDAEPTRARPARTSACWRPNGASNPSIEIAEEIRRHIGERGISPVDFALAWVFNNKLITSAIAGPRTFEQWEGYVKALDYRFTAEDEALVNRLVAAGHPSTPGYTDPGHPVEGRVPHVAAAQEE